MCLAARYFLGKGFGRDYNIIVISKAYPRFEIETLGISEMTNIFKPPLPSLALSLPPLPSCVVLFVY